MGSHNIVLDIAYYYYIAMCYIILPTCTILPYLNSCSRTFSDILFNLFLFYFVPVYHMILCCIVYAGDPNSPK